jgi:hypothetical protein
MQQVCVGSEVIYPTIGRIAEAGTCVTGTLAQQRIGDGSIGVVNDGDRKVHGGRWLRHSL